MNKILYILLVLPFAAIGQTSGKNYVKTTVYNTPYTQVPANPDQTVQVNYFDGLGRAQQSVVTNAGGGGQDVVTHIEYDAFGRQVKEYLPFASEPGATPAPYIGNPIDKLNLLYLTPKYENTANYYSEKYFEKSPLNRVLEQGAPGFDWKLSERVNVPANTMALDIYVEGGCMIPGEGFQLELQRPKVTFEIRDNVFVFKLMTPYDYETSWDQSEGCPLKTAPFSISDITFGAFDYPLPDMELGILTDGFGQSTGYKVFVQNNNIIFKPIVNGSLPNVKRVNTTLSFDLTPYVTQDSHTVKFGYAANKRNEVRRFGVDYVGSVETTALTNLAYYEPNQLFKTITKNENWKSTDGFNNTTEEFTDKAGRIVLKRGYDAGKKHDTYYVYDKFSNLSYVIPPLASDAVIIENITDINTNINFPVIKLLDVDPSIAAAYAVDLYGHSNSEILNVDMLDKYGFSGGFAVHTDSNNVVTLDLNIQQTSRLPIRTGIIADLSNFGQYADKELGRLYDEEKGVNYIFSIHGNAIEVDGFGDIGSINTSFNGYEKLEYSKNYPWTKICLTDPAVSEAYDEALKSIVNADILTTMIPNDNNAHGGFSISIDEFDTVTLSLNITSDVDMLLASGEFPLEIERSIADRYIGTLSGPFYSYTFSIVNNALQVYGTGRFTEATFFASIGQQISGTIEEQAVNGLCYIYNYDNRNRMIKKHIPDNGWTYIVYDNFDRPVCTQDENLRAKTAPDHNWIFTSYDAFGRVAITGSYYSPSTFENLRASISALTGVVVETRSSTPIINGGMEVYYDNATGYASGKVLTVNYYDDYNFNTGWADAGQGDQGVLGAMPTANSWDPFTTQTKGLSTGTMVRVLGTEKWTTSFTKYDVKARPIWEWSYNNHLNAWHGIQSHLDFTGKLIDTKVQHKKTGVPAVVYTDHFTYDKGNRLLRQYRYAESNGDFYTRPIVWNKYDELGQLEQKKVGGLSFSGQQDYETYPGFQKVDYGYNIRGWLKNINDIGSMGNDFFAFRIGYSGLYNGNIASTAWKSANDNIERSYSYEYDNLNRLKNANFTGGGLNFNEGSIVYDKNGNIIQLTRYGQKTNSSNGLIDNLSYGYKPFSNQLIRVHDFSNEINGFSNGPTLQGADDYSYDPTGNMKKDLNKGIGTLPNYEIEYNHLNLPVKVQFGADKYISYVYGADGTKLSKTVHDVSVETITEYFNGFVYKNNALQYFSHPEGYVSGEAGALYAYVFQYKDHLGNVRLSFRDADNNGSVSNSEIIEEANYYPFGMQQKGYNPVATSTNLGQKIKYNGKELQDELGLNVYDYGWRNYMPDIGRWMQTDPLLNDLNFAFDDSQVDEDDDEEVLEAILTKAEVGDGIFNTNNLNPYTYGYNSPVVYDDPDGKCPTCITALIGAAVGGGIELGSQLLSGKSLRDVDWADVGVEALKGGLIGSGVGAGAALALNAGSTTVKASFDYSVSGGNANVFNGKKSLKSAAFDAGSDIIGAKVGGAVAKNVGKFTQKGVSKAIKAETKATKNLVKQTNKFNKATNGGRNVNQAAKSNLSKAQGASRVARGKTVRAQMVNSASKGAAGQTANNATQNVAKDKTKNQLGL
jgi:RHS repeat-associated protein